MNETNYNSLFYIIRSVNYDNSKLLKEKVSLDLTIDQLFTEQIYCCKIKHVFLKIRSENINSWESFKLSLTFK